MASSKCNTVKLTEDNWEKITKSDFHIDFLNARNQIREVIYELIKIDNEVKKRNVDIQNLKCEFDRQITCLENEVNRLRNDDMPTLDREDHIRLITEYVREIERANIEFSKDIEKFQVLKDKTCETIHCNVDILFQRKSAFKEMHINQIDSLKRFRERCDKSMRNAIETRLKSIDRKFCDELYYIESCEKDLKHIFQLIECKSSDSMICSSGSSFSEDSSQYAEFLTDFAWLRNEQSRKRSEIFEYFKKYLAKDLVQALSAMHVYQPEEPIKFLATFMKQLKYNEFRQRVQEKIFNAAKSGEPMIPSKTNKTTFDEVEVCIP